MSQKAIIPTVAHSATSTNIYFSETQSREIRNKPLQKTKSFLLCIWSREALKHCKAGFWKKKGRFFWVIARKTCTQLSFLSKGGKEEGLKMDLSYNNLIALKKAKDFVSLEWAIKPFSSYTSQLNQRQPRHFYLWMIKILSLLPIIKSALIEHSIQS